MRFLNTLSLLLLCLSGLWAQTQEAWIMAAEEAVARKDHYSAYQYYAIAAEYDTSRYDLQYNAARAALAFNAVRAADSLFQRVALTGWRDSFPTFYYEWAETKQKGGFYEAARGLYQHFIDKGTNLPLALREKAEWAVVNCAWAAEAQQKRRNIAINHLQGDINTPYSDYGYQKMGDTAFFSSLRFPIPKDTVQPGRFLNRILYKIGDQPAQYLEPAFNHPQRHAANLAFTPDRKRAFFTRCDYVNNTEIRCELYTVSIDENTGKWVDPMRLDINKEGYSFNHPHVSTDPSSGQVFLYFASNSPGTMGGFDIWRAVVKDDGSLGAVENLEQINTDKDELTPFYYPSNQALYFSTNGRFSFGGYDIYKSVWIDNEWQRPENIGLPVNSSYNDLYYAIDAAEETAYFASDRRNADAVYWDEAHDACCYDIYAADAGIRVFLLAKSFDKRSNEALVGATFEIYEIKDSLPPVKIGGTVNGNANDFSFVLQPSGRYLVQATKPGYRKDEALLDLTNPLLANRDTIEQALFLDPAPKLMVSTFNKLDSSALSGTSIYLYRRTADEGDVLLSSADNIFGNSHTFLLTEGDTFVVIAQKEGYRQADMVFPLNNEREFSHQLYLEPGLQLDVQLFRKLDGQPLEGGRLQLAEVPLAATKRFSTNEKLLPNTNTHTFSINYDNYYVLSVVRPGYRPVVADTIDMRRIGPVVSGVVEKKYTLYQELEVSVFDGEKRLPLSGASVDLYRPATRGNSLLGRETNNKDNVFRFQTDMTEPLLAIVRRKGYVTQTDTIVVEASQLVADEGKAVWQIYLNQINFNQLQVFFDNDQPDPKSYSSNTSVNYIQNNEQYYNRRDEFIREVTEGMDPENAFAISGQFIDFFDREVLEGRAQLEAFAARLLLYLQEGNAFVLKMRGYASRRASEDYNLRLSARRIASVRNYLERYNNGAIAPFIQRGQLTFEAEPLGASTSKELLTNRYANPIESVFSLGASVERRVEITVVAVQ